MMIIFELAGQHFDCRPFFLRRIEPAHVVPLHGVCARYHVRHHLAHEPQAVVMGTLAVRHQHRLIDLSDQLPAYRSAWARAWRQSRIEDWSSSGVCVACRAGRSPRMRAVAPALALAQAREERQARVRPCAPVRRRQA